MQSKKKHEKENTGRCKMPWHSFGRDLVIYRFDRFCQENMRGQRDTEGVGCDMS